MKMKMTAEEIAKALIDGLEKASKKSPTELDPETIDDKYALWVIKDDLRKIKAIMYLINSRRFFLPDEQINRLYTWFNLRIDRVLEKKSLKSLKDQKPDLMWDTLAGADWDIAVGLVPDVILEMEKFWGKVELMSIKAGEPDIPEPIKVFNQSQREKFENNLADYAEKLDAVQEEMGFASSDSVIEFANLTLDLDGPTLRYKLLKPIKIAPKTDPILMLELLMRKEHLVEYHEIANYIGLNKKRSWKRESKTVIAEALRAKKRDLKDILKKTGMKKKYRKDFIKSSSGLGYYINLDYDQVRVK